MKPKFNFVFFTMIMAAVFLMNFSSAVYAAEGVAIGDVETIDAKVLAIDKATRTLTLLGTNGNTVTLAVGPEARNFDQIEIGDHLNVKFYESVAVYLGKPGTLPAANAETVLARSPKGDKPAGILAETVDVSAIVTAINRDKRIVTLKKADGKEVSTRVDESVQAFDSLNVGDSVHARYTQAMAISVSKP